MGRSDEERGARAARRVARYARRVARYARRVARYDWPRVEQDLDAQGFAVLPGLLTRAECASVVALYSRAKLFRRRVVLEQHGYGRGEYQYFAYPLPPLVATLRASLYPPLAAVANRWSATLGRPERYPGELEAFLALCHAAGQTRPTPLMLAYGEGDENRLHQDLYGALAFPLQVAVLCAEPGVDFEGGELVLTEQRPRMQSRAMVVPLSLGDAAIFATSTRPAAGRRGPYAVTLRHGVSRIRSGRRHVLGLIFHDAT